MEKVIKDFGKVNIMVTVAGTAGNRQPAETFDIDEWQKVMNVNVRGTMLCAKYAGAEYIKQGDGGKVITIGSVRGFLGHPGGYAAYGTSKGAVHLLTKQLATEWAKYKINVNAIAPSIFWTPLTQQVRTTRRWSRSSWHASRWAGPPSWTTSSARPSILASPGLRLRDRAHPLRGRRRGGRMKKLEDVKKIAIIGWRQMGTAAPWSSPAPATRVGLYSRGRRRCRRSSKHARRPDLPGRARPGQARGRRADPGPRDHHAGSWRRRPPTPTSCSSASPRTWRSSRTLSRTSTRCASPRPSWPPTPRS